MKNSVFLGSSSHLALNKVLPLMMIKQLKLPVVALCAMLTGCVATEPPEGSLSSSESSAVQSSTTTTSSINSVITSSSSINTQVSSSSANSTSIEGDAERGRKLIQGPLCNQCHSDNGDGTFGIIPFNVNGLVHATRAPYSASTVIELANYIENEMPPSPPTDCDAQCAVDAATYLWSYIGQAQSSAQSSSTPSLPPFTFSPEDVQKGKVLYEQQCAYCHGDEGEGAIGFPAMHTAECSTCSDGNSLTAYIDAAMPTGKGSGGPRACAGDCAKQVAAYIIDDLNHPEEIQCSAIEVGEHKPLRRLTKVEYTNTVKQVFDLGEIDTVDLIDDLVKPFDTNADALLVIDVHVDAFYKVAGRIAEQVAKTIKTPGSASASGDQCNFTGDCKTLFGDSANDCANSGAPNSICMCGNDRCDERFPSILTSDSTDPVTGCAQLNDTCADHFIADKGLQLFRRPLTSIETDHLKQSYLAGKSFSFNKGIEFVIEAMLQHPAFLYLAEYGNGTVASGGLSKLSSWELATRLSLLITGSAPDETLLQLAEEGKLQDANTLRQQADRLLASTDAKELTTRYFTQWLELGRLDETMRDVGQHPGWSNDIPSLWQQELAAFVGNLFDDDSTPLSDIYSADYTFANAKLANFYGLSVPDDGSFHKINAANRPAGVLTQGGFLAHNARTQETAPILRGTFMLEKVFCGEFGDPPADADAAPPPDDPSATNRQRTDTLTLTSGCDFCHKSINPAGYLFESFDPTGRIQAVDNSQTIDTTASIIDTDINGSYANIAEFAQALKQSERASQCFVRHYLGYALGKELHKRTRDDCVVENVHTEFSTSDGSIKSLIRAIVNADAFMYIKEGN